MPCFKLLVSLRFVTCTNFFEVPPPGNALLQMIGFSLVCYMYKFFWSPPPPGNVLLQIIGFSPVCYMYKFFWSPPPPPVMSCFKLLVSLRFVTCTNFFEVLPPPGNALLQIIGISPVYYMYKFFWSPPPVMPCFKWLLSLWFVTRTNFFEVLPPPPVMPCFKLLVSLWFVTCTKFFEVPPPGNVLLQIIGISPVCYM